MNLPLFHNIYALHITCLKSTDLFVGETCFEHFVVDYVAYS